MFQDLDEAELDYLGIQEEEQRSKLLAAAEALYNDQDTSSTSSAADKQPFSRSILRCIAMYKKPSMKSMKTGMKILLTGSLYKFSFPYNLDDTAKMFVCD